MLRLPVWAPYTAKAIVKLLAIISAFFYYAGKDNERGMRWSAASLIGSVLIMIVLIAKRYFFDSEDARRPELFVSGARMTPLVAGQPETVVLGVGNRGNAPARNIRLGGGNHLFVSSSFEGPLEYEPVTVDTQPDLGPNEEKSIASHSFAPLSEERIKDLQENRLLFFHYAEGEYEDDDGTIYPIDFCFMYAPLAPTVMRICPEKYWPKKRKGRERVGCLGLYWQRKKKKKDEAS